MPDWSRIHEEKIFHASYLPLSLLSFFYGFGARLRTNIMKNRKKMSLPGFTVSIGNLTAGGTGKTPATCMMAEWAMGEGYKVAILSRGYGGQNKKKVSIVSDGEKIFAGPKEIGDEPYLLAKRLKGAAVVISKNRYNAGLEAQKRFGASFFILDDGYQHLRLKRDLNLLLLDASSPFGNGRLLPRGPLREPLGELTRADVIILTRAGAGKGIEIRDGLEKIFQGKSLFMGNHIPEKIIFTSRDGGHDPSLLIGKRVVAFAGIARPLSFRDTLINLGAEITYYKAFPDHHYFNHDEIRDLMDEKEKTGADFIITTEKDWARLVNVIPGDPALAYLTIRFDLLSERTRFFDIVRETIGEKGNNRQ